MRARAQKPGPRSAKLRPAHVQRLFFSTFGYFFCSKYYVIALDFNGVEKAYAIQAGRELRVMVESEKINDEEASDLSFQISQKIQTDMTYPGQVKVTVIRETRAVNIAK